MANTKGKSNQSMKASGKGKIIVGVITAVVLLIVAGFFVVISGLPQKLLTGEKIVLKNEDGTVRETVDKVSVAELSYYYYQVINSMGYGIDPDTLDTVYDEENGKTYRDMILDVAAQEAMNSRLMNKAAKENGFMEHSGSERYAELLIDNQRDMVENVYSKTYNVKTLDKWLKMNYGSGMSVNVYRNILKKAAVTEEYQAYAQQFELRPTEDEVKADYDSDPTNFLRADINMYFFDKSLETDAADDAAAIAACKAKAEAVAAKAVDSESFKNAVIEQVSEDAATAESLEGETDITFIKGVYKERAEMYGEGVADFLLKDGQIGEAKVIETENGAYAFFIVDRYLDETPTVVYRSLTLENDVVVDDDHTQADVDKALSELENKANGLAKSGMSALEFSDLVKKNSDLPAEIISGGFKGTGSSSFYYNGVTNETDFGTVYDDAKASKASIDADPNYEATATDYSNIDNAALGEWLFADGRKAGDVVVMRSADGSSVTVYYIESVMPAWIYNNMIAKITTASYTWRDTVIPADAGYEVDYKLMKYYLT